MSFSGPSGRRRRTIEKPLEDTWEFKTCKKIAQLTKVIYTLNCRSEDNETRFTWIQECHRNELERLAKEYESKIAQLTEKIEQIDSGKAASLTALEKNQSNTIAELKSDFSERAQKMADDLVLQKKLLNERLDAEIEKNKEILENEVANAYQLKDKEVEKLVKEYNAKYNDMLLEQLNAKDVLEKELNASWSQKVAELEERLRVVQDALGGKLRDASKNLDLLESKNKELFSDLNKLRHNFNQIEEEKARVDEENKILRKELDDEIHARSSANASENDLKKAILSLREELDSKDLEIASLKPKLNEAEEKSRKALADSIDLENRVSVAETERNAAQNAMELLKEKLVESEKKCSELLEKVNALSSRANCSEGDLEKLRVDLEKANQKIVTLQNEILKLTQSCEAQMKMLKEEHEEEIRLATENIGSKKEELHKNELDSLRRNLMESFDEEMAKIKNAHAKEIENLKSQHVKDSQALHDMLENFTGKETELAAELQRTKEGTLLLEKKLQSSVKELELLRSEYSENITNKDKLIADLQIQIGSLSSQTAESEEEGRIRQERLKEEMREAIENLKNEHCRELNLLKLEFENSFKELSAKHQSEIDAAKVLHDEILRSARSDAANELNDKVNSLLGIQHSLNAQIEKLIAEGKLKEAQLNGIIDQLKKQLDFEKQNREEESRKGSTESSNLKARIDSLRDEMAQQEARHEKTIQLAKEKHLAELEKELARLKQMHEHEKLHLEQKMAHTVEKMEKEQVKLTEDYKKKLDSEQQHHEKALKDALINHNAKLQEKIKELQQERDAMLDDLTAKHNKEFNWLKQQLEEATSRISQQSASRTTLENELSAEKRKNEHLKREASKEREAASATLSKASAENQLLVENLNREHQHYIAKLKKDHQNSLSQLSNMRQKELAQYRSMEEQLRHALRELQHKYDFRESRQEDVDLINKLMKENKEKKLELEKAYNDMRYFKMELVNREENYNKVFNRRPVVAAGGQNQMTSSVVNFPKAALSLPDIKPHSAGK